MAGWLSHFSNVHIVFTEAIFNRSHIECEPQFWYMPHLDRWEGYFKTKFKYLSLNDKREIPHDFTKTHDEFIEVIESIKETFTKEYQYYFNDLWC